MDRYSSYSQRLGGALPFMGVWFAVGFAIAVWDPHPRLILTVAVGISVGMLMLGPYAAAALYAMRLQRFLGGHLRWPLCLLLAATVALLLGHVLEWTAAQLLLAGITAVVGTVLGHDATLAVLGLRERGELDPPMVLLFPVLVGLAVMAGYSSFGFAAGLLKFMAALVQ